MLLYRLVKTEIISSGASGPISEFEITISPKKDEIWSIIWDDISHELRNEGFPFVGVHILEGYFKEVSFANGGIVISNSLHSCERPSHSFVLSSFDSTTTTKFKAEHFKGMSVKEHLEGLQDGDLEEILQKYGSSMTKREIDLLANIREIDILCERYRDDICESDEEEQKMIWEIQSMNMQTLSEASKRGENIDAYEMYLQTDIDNIYFERDQRRKRIKRWEQLLSSTEEKAEKLKNHPLVTSIKCKFVRARFNDRLDCFRESLLLIEFLRSKGDDVKEFEEKLSVLEHKILAEIEEEDEKLQQDS